MVRAPSLLLSLSLVAACATPDAARPPSADATRDAPTALDRLRAASRVPVTIRSRDGAVVTARVQVAVDGDDPVARAYAYLAAFGELYGVSDPDAELWPVSVRQAEDGDHVVLRRRVGELPWLDGELSLHLSGREVLMTQGLLGAPLAAVAPPTLSAERAVEIAEDRALDALGEPALGVAVARDASSGRRESVVVWRVPVAGTDASGATGSWEVDVDAATGRILRSVATSEGAKDLLVGSALGSAYEGSFCWLFSDYTPWFEEGGALSSYDPSLDLDLDGQRAFELASDTWAVHNDELGWDGWDGDGALVNAIVDGDLPPGVGVASSSGVCNTLQFEDTWAVKDIFVHEFTHQVDDATADLDYSGFTGALDESFADVAGALADANWTIGEKSGGNGFRSLKSPPDEGHPDHVDKAVSGDGKGLRDVDADKDNGFVHTNSGIPNKVAYLVIEGDTHNGYTTPGMGTLRGRKLYHDAHVNGFSGVEDFQDARDVMAMTLDIWQQLGITAQGDAYVWSDVCAMKNAWASVGVAVAGADLDCDGLGDGFDQDDDGDLQDDTWDNCPDDPNPVQTDWDGDDLGDACDDDDDEDGILDPDDNCDHVPSADQTDSNGDGEGDLCDDTDHDGTVDAADNCVKAPNPGQENADGDPFGDACDVDDDGDEVLDWEDNCPDDANPDQADGDEDQVGDVCDNCVDTENTSQMDCDHDGLGNACDDDWKLVLCNPVIDWAEYRPWVHPLDLVSLPHVDDLRVGPDARLEVTVSAGVPLAEIHVVDRAGSVVARGAPDRDGVVRLTFTPAPVYRLPESGERAPWSEAYAVQFPPARDLEGYEASIAVRVIAP